MFLHNRRKNYLKKYLIVFYSENSKKKRRLNFVSFSGLKNSETKFSERKLCGDRIYIKDLWNIKEKRRLKWFYKARNRNVWLLSCFLKKITNRELLFSAGHSLLLVWLSQMSSVANFSFINFQHFSSEQNCKLTNSTYSKNVDEIKGGHLC